MELTLEKPPLIDASIEERVAALAIPFWIDYPQADDIWLQLERLLAHPKTNRMPNMILVGQTNSGKSDLLKKFVSAHPLITNPEDEATSIPVLMVQAKEPNESILYQTILERLFVAGSMREHHFSKLSRVMMLLRQLNTKMLILDEFSNASRGAIAKQGKFMDALRYIGNELQIPIVVSGVPKALTVIQSDPQLANRFEPVVMERWEDPQQYSMLLRGFEPHLLLREPCAFKNKAFCKELLKQTDGVLGETLALLRKLAERSMKSGKEKIDGADLEPEVLKQVKWVRPSMRQSDASKKSRKASGLVSFADD